MNLYETIGQVVVGVLVLGLLVYGFSVAIRYPPLSVAKALPSAEPVLVLPSPVFEAIGTLFFYPNNVFPVPYLLYHDEAGNPYTKSLIVSNALFSRLSLQGYAYRQVKVKGILEAEHVLVSQVTSL